MKIINIEPTPSPNSMKINFDESLPEGVRHNYTKTTLEGAPPEIIEMFNSGGITNIYHVQNFFAVERHPKADWEEVLSAIRKAYGQADEGLSLTQASDGEDDEEITVLVQRFRGLPMQIKLRTASEEKRVGLPDRFTEAALEAQKVSSNLVMEREWVDEGVRYGSLDQVGQEVAEELSAAYPQERLHFLVKNAHSFNETQFVSEHNVSRDEVAEKLLEDSWETRYAALERMNPTVDDLMVLKRALKDEKASIRRLAVVYLGMIEDEAVLPLLYMGLKDKSASVRRTAGDALSDIGNAKAIPAMCEALEDKNKLVRWRAARFLFDLGDERALPALKAAEHDPEFEVRLQVKIALERIQRGEEAAGTVWQQMTEHRRNH
ncbi:conserved virulence factor C family protein [Fictibacillus iocasae]|uniref:Conserved virulence factor C family protein n=1 Tax=Fictibacillus iocasae TaxID=2715437 RepID=A0ABW2NST7_9BACL